MSKEMVISANPHETRVAIMEEGQLCEYYVERQKEFALVGSIYKGRVTRVLPGMQSAFVEIGLDSDAFLYVTRFPRRYRRIRPHRHHGRGKSSEDGRAGRRTCSPPAGQPLRQSNPSDVESGPVATPEGHAVEPLPGESISQPTSNASAPYVASAPPFAAPPFVRPARRQFEPPPRRSRLWPTRWTRTVADGGRHGRPGGGGGGRGDNRRFGRELPSSKYASPRAAR